MESKNEEILMNDNKSFKDQSINLLDSAQIDKIEIQKPKKKIFSNYYGLFFGVLSALCLSVSNVLIKKANFFNGSDTTAFRYTIQLILMLLIALITKQNLLGPKEMRKILFLRGFIGTISVLCLHVSVKFINPSDTTSLFNLSIVFVPIIARFYIKEKFSIMHLIALVISILGVLFIAQPAFLFQQNSQLIISNNYTNNLTNITTSALNASFNKIFGISIGLLSAFLSAVVAVLLKKLTIKKVHYSVTIIYASYVGIPVSILISLIMYLTSSQKHNMELVQDMPSVLYQIGFGSISGLFAVVSIIFKISALKYDDTSKVAIICSTDLLFSFLFQYLLLNITVNLFSIVGACLIFFATFFIFTFQILEKFIFNKNKAEKSNDENETCSFKKCLFLKF